MPTILRHLLTLKILAVLWASLASSLIAQSKLDEGEPVRVLYLQTWQDGIVLGKDKRLWVVEFEWANSPMREGFERSAIRKLCEVEAMDYSRTWESASGKFKVDAALKAVEGENIVLIKTDMDEVTVPLASLSDSDVAYVNKLKKQNDTAVARGTIPARTPTLPEIEDFAAGFGASAAIAIGGEPPQPLGPLPGFFKDFTQSGMGFVMSRARQKLVAVIPVGGPEQWVLMTAREDNFMNRGAQFQSQAYWVSLKSKKVVGTIYLTPEDYVVDYDPVTRTLLSVHQREHMSDSSDIFTLWSLKPGDSNAQPLRCWRGMTEGWPDPIFAKIVNENIVVTKSDRQTYTAWDLSKKEVAYSFKQGSFFDSPVVFTNDRLHLIVPEDGKLTVFNAVTGDVEFSMPVRDNQVSGANISPDGNRLVALTERNIYVWDLKSSNSEPAVYPAPLIGNPFGSRIEWIDEDQVLVETHSERVLYRLSLQLPVWCYRMETDSYWHNRDPLKNMVIDGLFFYVAEPNSHDGSIAVGAVKLPGPGVDEVTRDIDREMLYVVKPGVAVGLQLKAVTDPASVEQWLREKIEANGWVYDPHAEIIMTAEMGVGKTQSETYREFGLGGQETVVSFTPHYSRLEIRKGDMILWQTGISTGAPPISRASNIQAEVTSMQKPQLGFFKSVTIDQKILDPKFSLGFGVSSLSLRGIQVVSTTPPGRTENAADAEQRTKADQEKDLNRQREGQGGGSGTGNSGGDGFGNGPIR